jgi:hypothetical protein
VGRQKTYIGGPLQPRNGPVVISLKAVAQLQQIAKTSSFTTDYLQPKSG